VLHDRDDPQAGVASNDAQMNSEDQAQQIGQEQVRMVLAFIYEDESKLALLITKV
jgi:hypothetical protein